MSDTVRIGFIGTGFIAQLHASMLDPVPDCHIGPIFDADGARAAEFAEQAGGVSVGSADAVVNDCDAVIIATWTSAHPPAVEAAVAAGRPLLCEKPLAVDLATARELSALVAGSGLVNQVGLVMRRSPAFRWLRAQLADTDNGPLMNVIFRDDQYLPVGGQYGSDWRADVARAGGGALLEHSIHDVDLLDWLAGPLTTVSARIGHRHDIDGIDDQVTATFTTESGAQAVLVSVWHDIRRRPSGRRVEAFCADALLTIEGEWAGPVHREADREVAVLADRELVRSARRFDGEGQNPDAAFVEAVRSGTPATPDFGTALRAHELVDAAYRSAAQDGAVIKV